MTLYILQAAMESMTSDERLNTIEAVNSTGLYSQDDILRILVATHHALTQGV